MPRAQPRVVKPLLLAGAVLILWTLLPAAMKSLMRVSFYEFKAPAWSALTYLRDLQDYWSLRVRSKDELIQAGRDLARLNAAYIIRLQEAAAVEQELHQLESLLRLPPLPAYRPEPARVIKRDFASWTQSLIIRKGQDYGLQPGMAVIYRDGVVGRVAEVFAFTSRIELLTSPGFRMAAHVEGDTRPVTFRGALVHPPGQARGRAINIPGDIVSQDEGSAPLLVSSRLGGVFPDGIVIGSLQDLELAPDGLFQAGLVHISAEILSLREVAVLVPVDPNQKSAPPAAIDILRELEGLETETDSMPEERPPSP
jgi:rod shape-determining protein MreC